MNAISHRIKYYRKLLLGSFVVLPWAIVGFVGTVEYIIEKVFREDTQTKETILSFFLFDITNQYFLYVLIFISIIMIVENTFRRHQELTNLAGSLEKDRPLLKITRENFDCFLSLPQPGAESGGDAFLDNTDSSKLNQFTLYNLGDQNAINIRLEFSFPEGDLLPLIKEKWPFEKIDYDDGSISVYTEYSHDKKDSKSSNFQLTYDSTIYIHIIKKGDNYEIATPTGLQRMYNIFSQVISFNKRYIEEGKIKAQKIHDTMTSGDPQLIKQMFSEWERENLSLMPNIKIDISYESADGRKFTDVKIQRSIFRSFGNPIIALDKSSDKEKYVFVPTMGTVSVQDEEAQHGSFYRHVANLGRTPTSLIHPSSAH